MIRRICLWILIFLEAIMGLLPGFSIDVLRLDSDAQLIGIQITLAIIWFIANREIDSNNVSNIREAQAELTSAINRLEKAAPRAELITHDDFYTRMLHDTQTASKVIYTSYFNDTAPKSLPGSSEADYYDKLFKIVKKRQNVEFKRVELFSPAKIDWLDKMIGELKTTKNGSLYLIRPIETAPDAIKPYISTQIVDDSVYLVAVAKHYAANDFRDILLKQSGVQRMWVDYYENKLVKNGIPIVANGHISEIWATIKNTKQLPEM